MFPNRKNRRKNSTSVLTGGGEREGSPCFKARAPKKSLRWEMRALPLLPPSALASLSSGRALHLYHPFSLLPSCPFQSSLSFLSCFLSLLLLPPACTPLSPPYVPRSRSPSRSSDAELGLQKRHCMELMALGELLFGCEPHSALHREGTSKSCLVIQCHDKVTLELRCGVGTWQSGAGCVCVCE